MEFKNVASLVLLTMLATIALTSKSQYLEISNDQLIHSQPSGLVHQAVAETLPRRPTRVLKTLGRRRRPPVRRPPAPNHAVHVYFSPPSPPTPPPPPPPICRYHYLRC